MTPLIDPNDNELKQKINNLQPSPGYCVFIDIVDSARMKQSERTQWIAFIYNTFSNALAYLNPFRPLKSIGDALMYYITDEELSRSGYSPLQIFSGLAALTAEKETYFKPVKIGAARCEDVYGITFTHGADDYYGRDIDLTSRLLEMAAEREIVINGQFRDIALDRYQAIGNRDQFAEVQQLQGPWPVIVKGFDSYIYVYKLPKRS